MRLGYLLTSFEGRINRKPFWLSNIALVVIFMVVAIAIFAVLGARGTDVTDRLANRIGLIGLLILLYPSAALLVKRLHDRDRPGILAAVFLGPSLLVGITDALGITGRETWNALELPAQRTRAGRHALGYRRTRLHARHAGTEPLRPGPVGGR